MESGKVDRAGSGCRSYHSHRAGETPRKCRESKGVGFFGFSLTARAMPGKIA